MRFFLLLLFVSLYSLAHASEIAVQRWQADWSLLKSVHNETWSDPATKQLERFYEKRLQALGQADFKKMSRDNQVDHLLLRIGMEQEQIELARFRERLDEQRPYLPFIDTITGLEVDRRKVASFDHAETAKRIASIGEEVKQGRKYLDEQVKPPEKKKEGEEEQAEQQEEPAPVVSKAMALRMSHTVRQARERLDRWYKHYAAYRPGFDWWMKKPYEGAKKSLEEYEKHLREKVAGHKENGPLIGEPVGRERLLQLLRGEILPYTPEELIAIGEREFAWCEAEMKKAAQEMGFEDPMQALEKVKSLHVKPGEQDQLVAQYGREAADFVTERKLVTVPYLCREVWNINMIEPKVQKKIPYAMYGGNRVMVAFAANSMDQEKKEMSMRGNNLHATRIVTAHELIPGHHLQRFMAQRHRPYRGIFSTPFYVEGWALYWEMRLWDLDFARGPEDRVGMLFWRMHRCARIIVTLKYQLGQMKPGEMVEFLEKRVGHENEQATAEVRRFIDERTPPLYQCGYMIGGLQLKALYEELVPKKMKERAFHDAVLKLGPIPIEMIRASLTDEPLTHDYQSRWKFDE